MSAAEILPANGSACWRVLVVEDDPAVAAVQRRLIDVIPGFRAVGTAGSGELGYQAIGTLEPDLAIVDLTMPGGDGLGLLRRLRREARPIEVVVVTASRDAATIREVMHLGVVDYLVKPFAPERLWEACNAFARRAQALASPTLAQAEIDVVQSTGARRIHRLPKGLRRSTLGAVRAVLDRSGRPLTADEVGAEVGIARVTARRYLEYLEVVGAARVERQCNGPGRPRNRYRSTAEAAAP